MKISVLDYQIRQKNIMPIDLVKLQKALSHYLFEQSPIAFLKEDFLKMEQRGKDFLFWGGDIFPKRLLQTIKKNKACVRNRDPDHLFNISSLGWIFYIVIPYCIFNSLVVVDVHISLFCMYMCYIRAG